MDNARSNATNARPNASAAGPTASSAGASPSTAGPNPNDANGLPQSEAAADQSSPSGMVKPPSDKEGNAPAAPTPKGRKKPKDPNAKPQREYLYWEDANDIEWRREMEYKGYENWRDKFGPGTEWWDRYE